MAAKIAGFTMMHVLLILGLLIGPTASLTPVEEKNLLLQIRNSRAPTPGFVVPTQCLGFTLSACQSWAKWSSTTDMCSWSGVGCTYGLARNVRSLRLADSDWGGSLPPAFSQLEFLEFISVGDPQGTLTGTVPLEWSEMKSLEYLQINNSPTLGGDIPWHWGSGRSSTYSTLQEIHMSNLPRVSEFKLPDTWGNMRFLKNLSLRNMTNVTGTLPSQWSRMESLDKLMLDSNSLSGTLPREWSMIGSNYTRPVLGTPKTIQIDLSRNLLNGSVPFEWNYMKKQLVLTINENCLNDTASPLNNGNLWVQNAEYTDNPVCEGASSGPSGGISLSTPEWIMIALGSVCLILLVAVAVAGGMLCCLKNKTKKAEKEAKDKATLKRQVSMARKQLAQQSSPPKPEETQNLMNSQV